MSYRPVESHCTDIILCPGGNCVGCKNGRKWCSDPRCEPYCTDCLPRPNQERLGNMVIFVILLGLLAIVSIYIAAYSPNTIYYYKSTGNSSYSSKDSSSSTYKNSMTGYGGS